MNCYPFFVKEKRKEKEKKADCEIIVPEKLLLMLWEKTLVLLN